MNTPAEIQAAETARPYYDPMANWDLIPSHMHGAVKRYVMHGIAPGHFLTAAFCNMPANSQGSPERFRAWIDRGGLANEAEAA